MYDASILLIVITILLSYLSMHASVIMLLVFFSIAHGGPLAGSRAAKAARNKEGKHIEPAVKFGLHIAHRQYAVDSQSNKNN